MNRAGTTLLALALLAAPLLAEEKAKAKSDGKKTAQTTDTAAATSTQAPVVTPGEPSPEDSPLVQAAKRSNRLGKKPTNVITNETLKASGAKAHVTTTKEQEPMYIPPPHKKPAPTPEMIAAQKAELRRKAEEKAKAEAAKKEAAKQERVARAADDAEELYADDERIDDPAQAEKRLEDAHADKPPEQKPPAH
jgi:hypothetical protein